MTKKTKLMLRVEQQIGQPLETALPRLISEQGVTDTASQLRVSKATINYWMMKLNIHVQRIAITREDSIIVKRPA